MKTINLRDYYPYYSVDMFVDVPDDVAVSLIEAERKEKAARRRMYRHSAEYSLDRNDGIEYDVCFLSLSPCEAYERKISVEQLYAALSALPDKQGMRIYAYYILGMSKAQIARIEGVSEKNIRKSISQALRSMETFLKNLSD